MCILPQWMWFSPIKQVFGFCRAVFCPQKEETLRIPFTGLIKIDAFARSYLCKRQKSPSPSGSKWPALVNYCTVPLGPGILPVLRLGSKSAVWAKRKLCLTRMQCRSNAVSPSVNQCLLERNLLTSLGGWSISRPVSDKK